MLGITEIKLGKTIVLNDEPYKVTWNQHSKKARGGGVMKTKLKNLITGKTLERTFQGNDKVDEADVSFRRSQYLYANGENYEFMDQESYETISLSREILGNDVNFLIDGMDVDLQYFNGKPINIQLPAKLTFEVTQTDPGVQGDRSNAGTKPATISTGYEIQIPLFVNTGDRIVINTDTGEYSEREKK